MLRKIRLTLAVLFFTAVTLLFLDFTGTLHAWLGWTAKIQFLPALLALNVGVVVFLVLLTLAFGRVYCSIICPLGVMQDIIAWVGKKQKKNRYGYSPAKSWLRYSVLAVFIIAMIAGIGSLVALLAPYSSYGRIAGNLFAPIYGWGNNLLAYFAERADSYAFYETEVWLKSLPTFFIALLSFIIIGVLAWRNGRIYCNTICPVGTVLGFLARFSWLKPVIDKDKCVNWACIDIANHRIDYSRCVACMDCIGKCHKGAISYKHPAKEAAQPKAVESKISAEQINDARRSFLTATALVATTAALKAQEKKVDGGLAIIESKKIPDRKTPIVPPGALSARDFARHCTACQLCVSVCPNGVLRPSTDLTKLMQPEMGYERGYCRPECTKCSEVCSGEIRHADWSRRMDQGELCAADRWRGVWQLCPPLSDGSHTDDTLRCRQSRFAQDSGHQRGALHRLRGLRESLSGTPVQCNLCGRARDTQGDIR